MAPSSVAKPVRVAVIVALSKSASNVAALFYQRNVAVAVLVRPLHGTNPVSTVFGTAVVSAYRRRSGRHRCSGRSQYRDRRVPGSRPSQLPREPPTHRSGCACTQFASGILAVTSTFFISGTAIDENAIDVEFDMDIDYRIGGGGRRSVSSVLLPHHVRLHPDILAGGTGIDVGEHFHGLGGGSDYGSTFYKVARFQQDSTCPRT